MIQQLPWRPIHQTILLVVLVVFAASCSRVPRDVSDPGVVRHETLAPESFPLEWYQAKQSLPGSRIYKIDPGRSLLKIKVYRDGRLAKYGHNHIVSSNNINGLIYIDKVFSKSRIDSYISVNSLIVDDPVLRAEAGEDFSAHVTEQAITGTRTNMLSERVLNIRQYPYLFLSAVPKNTDKEYPELITSITIRDNRQTLIHSPKLKIDGEELSASGVFTIRQTGFGIEPFSVMLGALRVKDELTIEYQIKANSIK
ncbi:MAG: hypothetical protein EP297_02820 [Gammaproteobacteria bacterium]|nr:MAG: hypothetical protein EP297_02820 [Gammaproteobacteria bacterium]